MLGVLAMKHELRGSVVFSTNRHSVETMERFAANFQHFLTSMLQSPDRSVSDVVFV
jgi:hypothetical protein